VPRRFLNGSNFIALVMFLRTGIDRSAMDDHLELRRDVIELFALFPTNRLHHLAIDWADDVRFGQGVFDDFLGQSVGDQSATMFLGCALRGLLFLLTGLLGKWTEETTKLQKTAS